MLHPRQVFLDVGTQFYAWATFLSMALIGPLQGHTQRTSPHRAPSLGALLTPCPVCGPGPLLCVPYLIVEEKLPRLMKEGVEYVGPNILVVSAVGGVLVPIFSLYWGLQVRARPRFPGSPSTPHHQSPLTSA